MNPRYLERVNANQYFKNHRARFANKAYVPAEGGALFNRDQNLFLEKGETSLTRNLQELRTLQPQHKDVPLNERKKLWNSMVGFLGPYNPRAQLFLDMADAANVEEKIKTLSPSTVLITGQHAERWAPPPEGVTPEFLAEIDSRLMDEDNITDIVDYGVGVRTKDPKTQVIEAQKAIEDYIEVAKQTTSIYRGAWGVLRDLFQKHNLIPERRARQLNAPLNIQRDGAVNDLLAMRSRGVPWNSDDLASTYKKLGDPSHPFAYRRR